MTQRTRVSIPHYMDSPLTQVTDLEHAISQCLALDFEKPTIKICSYDGGLIRNEDKKPIYLTDFQKGYLHALLSLPQVNLQGQYICKLIPYEKHILYRTDGICYTCKARVMDTAKHKK